ncbi:type III pantothenate kinase [Propionivibrio sp.]|uniref:type III pantothenate kinase n=1 Tax=Propionivibrio sp. TaxID=2212460 RepID=UPI0026330F71|nr:type III pantothenate kinase [Propionivibrio sp.]
MIAIDAGNTRIKWGIHDGVAWQAQGALPTAQASRLAEVSTGWPDAERVVACNVAGEAVGAAISVALAKRYDPLLWLHSNAACCGVRNGYEVPERLGADRWAALIGARAQVSSACLVVCAGTATTVDWLDAHGDFRGGLILPGVDLMRASLARNTAQLPLAEGEFRCAPRNTIDAIVSGCLHAQIGAIERMFAALSAEPGAVCLLTGGAAPRLTPHLGIPFRMVETLILDGLVRFSASQ